jgi:hypothetical protein
VLLAIALTAACGSGNPGPTPTPTPTAVSAAAWVVSVCTTLAPWRTKIGDLNQQARLQMTPATTPEQARVQLIALLTGARDATESARASLVAAGTPTVAGGATIASRFVGSLEQVRDAYAHAVTALTELSPAAPDFYDRVGDIMLTLINQYGGSAIDAATLNSPDLQAAFAEQSKCQ